MVKSRPSIDAKKHKRILTAAMHAFARQGYHDTKTNTIAIEANVSKGLVFNYFESKGNLYLETVQYAINNILQVTDITVWQDSPDLESMVMRALRYKIQLQLQLPDEFSLTMQAYAEVGNLPETLRPKVEKIWDQIIQAQVPDMITPVLKRLPLRAELNPKTITKMISMMVDLIGDRAKEMIRINPHITIEEFDPMIDEVMEYMRILEYGFIAPE